VEAPMLALLAWAGDTLYGAGLSGEVFSSTDAGTLWVPRGSLPAQPGALTADGVAVAALVNDTILESTDGGRNFTPRITGLGGH
jgi:hypothetical protein